MTKDRVEIDLCDKDMHLVLTAAGSRGVPPLSGLPQFDKVYPSVAHVSFPPNENTTVYWRVLMPDFFDGKGARFYVRWATRGAPPQGFVRWLLTAEVGEEGGPVSEAVIVEDPFHKEDAVHQTKEGGLLDVPPGELGTLVTWRLTRLGQHDSFQAAAELLTAHLLLPRSAPLLGGA